MFVINIKSFKKTKISYIFKKTLSPSIVHSKCGHKYEKIFKEEESNETLKILSFINTWKSIRKYIIMPERNINQEFRLKKIDEI